MGVSTYPTDAKERKDAPMARGLLDYFPDALMDVARLSLIANEQHNPGEPLHWARGKSTDHADCIMRHLAERGTMDHDNVLHATKVAWRALALLQTELEEAAEESEEPAPEDVVWHDHTGQIKPTLLRGDAKIEVEVRSGKFIQDVAGGFLWVTEWCDQSDIIRWRYLDEPEG